MWICQVSCLLLVAGLAAACDGPAEPTLPAAPCGVTQVNALNSALWLPGRGGPLQSEYVLDSAEGELAPVIWTSSDSSIFSVTPDGDGDPKGPGDAVAVVGRCGIVDSVDVRVLPAGYDVTFIGGVGTGVNDAGQVVGTAAVSSGTYWLWESGAKSSIEQCGGLRINGRSEILCTERGPVIWSDGVASARDTFTSRSSIALNDSGHVVLSGDPGAALSGSPLMWRGPGQTVEITLFRYIEDVNIRGDILGSDDPARRTAHLRRDGTMRTLGSYGRYALGLALNDSGDVVGWTEYQNAVAHRYVAAIWRKSRGWAGQVFRPARGPLPSPIVSEAQDINNAGDVVGRGIRGAFVMLDGSIGFLSELVNDSNWKIPESYWLRITNTGLILAHGENSTTGQSGAVLLTPTWDR